MVFDFHGGEVKDKIEYDFSVNTNPCGIPSYVQKAILKNIDLCSEYPDRHCSKLSKEIAEYECLDASQILCGNGASELIMAICASFSMKKHMTAAIMAPTFSGYERAVKAFGGNVLFYKNAEELKELVVKNADLTIVFLCNPNNPTGEYIKKEDIEELVMLTNPKSIPICIDECFIEFTHEESLTNMVNKYDNLIVLKAFTKFFGLAGIRLGYMCAKKHICDTVKNYLPEWNVSHIAQCAGIAALRDKDELTQWKDETLSVVDTGREYLTEELRKLGIKVFESKTNYLLCKLNTKDIWTKLKDKGILVRDCSNFHELNASYIRICVSAAEKNKILIEALKTIL